MAATANANPTVASNVPQLSADNQTVTAAAGAATLDGQVGIVTTEALTTAAGADYTLTLTNARVKTGSVVLASVFNGSNSAGTPIVRYIAPGDGVVTIKVYNLHSANALNGTLKIAFVVL